MYLRDCVNDYVGVFRYDTCMSFFFLLGRGGLAITMVTQYDIERLKNVESNISKLHQHNCLSLC